VKKSLNCSFLAVLVIVLSVSGPLWSASAASPAKEAAKSPAKDAPKEKSPLVKRREAVAAWADSRSPMNAPSLLEALNDKDARTREIAVEGLRNLGWTPATVPLTNLMLTDAAFEVREVSAHALRSFKQASIVPSFQKCAIDDPHPAVRIACLDAAGDFPGPDVTKTFIAVSKERIPEVRRTAMLHLGRSNDPSAMPVLIAALKDADPAVRANAAQDLGTFAKMNQPSELKKLLIDPDPRVQASAARSLIMMGDISGFDVSMKAAKSTDSTTRQLGIDALGYTLDPTAEVLLGEIASGDSDVTIQQAAKLSLQRIAQRKKSK